MIETTPEELAKAEARKREVEDIKAVAEAVVGLCKWIGQSPARVAAAVTVAALVGGAVASTLTLPPSKP
jgi:hypothetical protein